MSGHQQMLTVHPEYYMKWLTYQRPIYAGQIRVQSLPQTPITMPTQPIINQEQRLRALKEGLPIYVEPQPQPYDITPVSGPRIEGTNEDIIENMNMRRRPWYPEAYKPYRDWPERLLQYGEQV